MELEWWQSLVLMFVIGVPLYVLGFLYLMALIETPAVAIVTGMVLRYLAVPLVFIAVLMVQNRADESNSELLLRIVVGLFLAGLVRAVASFVESFAE